MGRQSSCIAMPVDTPVAPMITKMLKMADPTIVPTPKSL